MGVRRRNVEKYRNGSPGYLVSSSLCLSPHRCPCQVKDSEKFPLGVSEHWTNVKRRWWSSERNDERSRNKHSETYQREITLKSFHCEVYRRSMWGREGRNSTWCPTLFMLDPPLRGHDGWGLCINEMLITQVMIKSFSLSVMMSHSCALIL